MKKEEVTKEAREQGKISFYNEQRGFGFLLRENRERLFFHCSDLEDDSHNPQQNDIMDFFVTEGEKGLKAVKVRRVEEQSEEIEGQLDLPLKKEEKTEDS